MGKNPQTGHQKLSEVIASYDFKEEDFCPVGISARTITGKDAEGNNVYAEVNTSVNLPANLLTYLAKIGADKALNYVKTSVETRLSNLARAGLKAEIALAKAQEREPSTDIALPFNNVNWVEYLEEQKREGKAKEAIRVATEQERKLGIENIKKSLLIVGRTVESLTSDEKNAINKSCGYAIF